MSGRVKAVVSYVAALIYTFGGIFLLKAAYGEQLRNLPLWASAALYVLFILPNVALVTYGYGQWIKAKR
ncbi:MAG TPA: hypothetical protein VFB08_07050 [Burkholderiales bacterium]|nr:hypothetical protein [Burkholderiales bacterium]